jgi:hypothetical protein
MQGRCQVAVCARNVTQMWGHLRLEPIHGARSDLWVEHCRMMKVERSGWKEVGGKKWVERSRWKEVGGKK